jgi:2Fe-2S ferredoxin
MAGMVKVVFITRDGGRKEFTAAEHSTLLRVAQAGGIDMEGACEGSMACSTCHVIVEPEWFAKLPAASTAEEDMLDLTYGVTRTSRLGCQITLTRELDGLTVRLPSATHNMMD